MDDGVGDEVDPGTLVVPSVGSLEETDDPFLPYRLLDADRVPIQPASAYFAELAARGRRATTRRSYAMNLLRWFRFLPTLGVTWNEATRSEPGTSAAGSPAPRSPSAPTGHRRHRTR